MKSPFSGMDPYLEAHWLDVHASFAIDARDQLRSQMPPGLIVGVEEYMSITFDEQPRNYSPDVRVHERGNGIAVAPASQGGMAVAEPLVIPLELEPATLRSVRILDTHSGDRIVTAIEFLSPANKTPLGRRNYLRKRHDLLEAGANLVELDLIRIGGDLLADSFGELPSEYCGPYRIRVLRSVPRYQAELYRATFKERLPAIRIPLREGDSDAVLDVQDMVDRSYEGGQYEQTIDYREDPSPAFDGDDRKWIDAFLRQQGQR